MSTRTTDAWLAARYAVTGAGILAAVVGPLAGILAYLGSASDPWRMLWALMVGAGVMFLVGGVSFPLLLAYFWRPEKDRRRRSSKTSSRRSLGMFLASLPAAVILSFLTNSQFDEFGDSQSTAMATVVGFAIPVVAAVLTAVRRS